MPLNALTSDRGSVAPLGLALLLGLIAMILSLAAAGHAALTGNRVQTLADAAILYAHDRLVATDSTATDSNPSASTSATSFANPNAQLDQHLRRYFELAGPLTRYQLNYSAEATPDASRIRLCVMWQNPLAPLAPRELCRTAVAKSFEVSD